MLRLDKKSGYKAFMESPELKSIAMDLLKDAREKSMSGSRSSAKAKAQDIRYVGDRVSKEVSKDIAFLAFVFLIFMKLSCLSKRADTSALLMIVRTSPEGTHVPVIYYDELSERFIQEGLGTPVSHMTTNFEAFAMSGMKGLAKKKGQANRDTRRIAAKAAVRGQINKGLRESRNASFLPKYLIIDSKATSSGRQRACFGSNTKKRLSSGLEFV